MASITVLGLGLMGSALARTLHKRGQQLIVWNRSKAKMQPFEKLGVSCADDLRSAVSASRVILVCIDNYASTRALLDTPEVSATLAGKTIVQVSSGTPKDAVVAADWAHALGATYLDGAILAGPKDIGTDEATILLSGDDAGFTLARPMLDCLGDGTVRYLGANVRAASALDLAWLMSRYGNFIAAIHAAKICQSEDVGVDELIRLVPDNVAIQRYAQVIHDQSFDKFTASLRVWGEALHHIQDQGRQADISTEIPDFIGGLFNRAMSAGMGESNVMSLIKVLDPPKPE